MSKLTQERFEAIRKRAEAATLGPWLYNDKYGYLAPEIPQRNVAVICNEIMCESDIQFIENAREDIPALLAEVERLRKIIDSQEQSTQQQILEETQRIRRELDRTRRERDFDWDFGY